MVEFDGVVRREFFWSGGGCVNSVILIGNCAVVFASSFHGCPSCALMYCSCMLVICVSDWYSEMAVV